MGKTAFSLLFHRWYTSYPFKRKTFLQQIPLNSPQTSGENECISMRANKWCSNVAWILLIRDIFNVLFQFSAQNTIQNYLTKPHRFSSVLRDWEKVNHGLNGRRSRSTCCKGSCWEQIMCSFTKAALTVALSSSWHIRGPERPREVVFNPQGNSWGFTRQGEQYEDG